MTKLCRIGLVLVLLSYVYTASAQSSEADAAWLRLKSRPSNSDLFELYLAESSKLETIDDVLWLVTKALSENIPNTMRVNFLSEKASILELRGAFADAASAWDEAAKCAGTAGGTEALLNASACRLASGIPLSADKTSGDTSTFDAARATTLDKIAYLIKGWSLLAQNDNVSAAIIANSLCNDSSYRIARAALYLALAASDGESRSKYEKQLTALIKAPELINVSSMILYTASTKYAAPISVETPADNSELLYQVGAFKDEANAKALLSKLQKLEFNAAIYFNKTRSIYVVYVKPSNDTKDTILALKNAGYEAWGIDSSEVNK